MDETFDAQHYAEANTEEGVLLLQATNSYLQQRVLQLAMRVKELEAQVNTDAS